MENKAKQLLKSKSIKVTRGRVNILSILLAAERPQSCEDIYRDLLKLGADINLSTVYRTVAGLVQNSLINAVNLPGMDKTLYEYSPHPHRHHLVCVGCNTILPLNGCPLKDFQQQVESKTGFKIKGHNLDLYGYCPSCNGD